jgi:basic amino acid/polyamine antiporter, APA family
VTVVTLYLLINFAYQSVLGTQGITASKLVAAALSRATFGPAGEALISVAIFLSAAGFINAVVIHMPRSYYAMARDGVLPRALLRVNPETQVQEIGLLVFGLSMLLPALLARQFDKLLNYVIFTDMITLAVVASTIFVLRRRHIGDGGFTVIGYPVLPAFYMLCLLVVGARVLVTETKLAIVGTAVLLFGWPLYWLGRRLFGPSAIGNPQPAGRRAH